MKSDIDTDYFFIWLKFFSDLNFSLKYIAFFLNPFVLNNGVIWVTFNANYLMAVSIEESKTKPSFTYCSIKLHEMTFYLTDLVRTIYYDLHV